MKFTRIFILRALNVRENNISNVSNNPNPIEVLKEIIISHPNIDLTLALILSVLLLLTKYNDDINFLYANSLNIYFITTLNVLTLFYYFCVDYLDQVTTNSINVNYINENGSIQNSNSSSRENLINNGNQEGGGGVEENIFDNSNRHNNPNNNNNNVSQLEAVLSFFNSYHNKKKIKIPPIIFNNWHIFKCILHNFKVFLSLVTYFLSLLFCMIYGEQKNKMEKEKYLLIHLLVLDFYEFYSGFRVCYFLIKILINIFLLPIYISSIFLGRVEDNFNDKLNKMINTKYYTGRTSIKSPPNGRVSEMEEYCSICLNSFQIDEMVSTLPCSRRHTFHTLCLEKWFLTTVTCPLCRSDFHNSINLFDRDVVEPRELRLVELNQNLL
jgi:hypothetical protein